MLEFINSNGVLFSGIFAVIAAIATSLITLIKEKQQAKSETVAALKKELEENKAKLEKYESFEKAEENIDKSEGSIYVESLPNGKTRDICGFCWEKNHIKIPVVRDIQYEEYTKQYYYDAYCNACKTHCIANYVVDIEENLPF